MSNRHCQDLFWVVLCGSLLVLQVDTRPRREAGGAGGAGQSAAVPPRGRVGLQLHHQEGDAGEAMRDGDLFGCSSLNILCRSRLRSVTGSLSRAALQNVDRILERTHPRQRGTPPLMNAEPLNRIEVEQYRQDKQQCRHFTIRQQANSPRGVSRVPRVANLSEVKYCKLGRPAKRSKGATKQTQLHRQPREPSFSVTLKGHGY